MQQLKLQNALKSVTSFHRQNLRYVVKECNGDLQDELLLTAVKNTRSGNVIVYSPTVARVGEIVDMLEENGIAAVGYHGQMDAKSRRENQEKWMTEEVRVLVGTIAFGLGINKPNVRAVIRLGLPESIEQLYQETGRAGRDGLPADCYLLWQKKDIGLRTYFIKKIGDSQEQKRAWERYDQMQHFVEKENCRPRMICEHFGETVKWEKCGHCDVCAGMPEWMHGESPGGKGNAAERCRSALLEAKRGAVCGRIFKFSGSDVNEELMDYLREWRRNKAKEKGVAAFIVLHDTSLEALCRVQPKTREQLMMVSGIGENKAELYGKEILGALTKFGKESAPRTIGRRRLPARAGDSGVAETGAEFRGDCGTSREESAHGGCADCQSGRDGRNGIPGGVDGGGDLRKIRETCGRLGMDLLRPIKDALAGGDQLRRGAIGGGAFAAESKSGKGVRKRKVPQRCVGKG